MRLPSDVQPLDDEQIVTAAMDHLSHRCSLAAESDEADFQCVPLQIVVCAIPVFIWSIQATSNYLTTWSNPVYHVTDLEVNTSFGLMKATGRSPCREPASLNHPAAVSSTAECEFFFQTSVDPKGLRPLIAGICRDLENDPRYSFPN